MIGRVLRAGAGLLLGTATALVQAVLLLVAAAAALLPAARPAVRAAAITVAAVERRRVERWFGRIEPGGQPTSGRRALRYLATRVSAGLLGGAILLLLGMGIVFALTLLWSWITVTPWAMESPPAVVVSGTLVAYYTVPGAVLLYLGIAGAVGVVRWERSLLRQLLAPTREEELARRVADLAQSRDAVIAAVDDERRRIERDLHDGVQQRVVALGMLLGRARRHPEQATDLIVQAHEEAQRVLTELRDVSWRVYPAALDTGGLAAALESVAERAPLPVRIACELPAEPPPPVRAVAWFVVCEAVTNAAKHSGASEVDVQVVGTGGRLRAAVRDDGRGGADPAGGGLAGLARRVAAADGTLAVSSPPGGPTVVTMDVPCG